MYIFTIFLLFLLFNHHNSFQLQIIKSSILKFLPELKEHSIVVLYENDNGYTIDFSPTNQTLKTLLNLFIGKNVESIIRIRYINDITNIESNEFIDRWHSQYNIEYTDIKNENIKNFIYKYHDIKKDMNLYKFNCQHFAKIIYNDYINNITMYNK